MARTGTELIDLALNWIGGRESGKIGEMSAYTASLYSLNNVLMDLAKDKDVPELERSYTVSVTSAGFQYDLPEDANNVRFKHIVGCRAIRSGDTYDYPLSEHTAMYTFAKAQTPISTNKGPLCFYRIFNRKLEFFPWPETSYAVTLYATIWPTNITATNAGQEHQYGVEWDAALEYGLTAELFHKLQRFEEAATWMGKYRDAKLQVLAALPNSNLTLDGRLSYRARSSGGITMNDSTIVHQKYNLDTGLWEAV